MTDKILIEMKVATFNYLSHHIRIELPDPEDSNIIYVSIYRQPGTYDPEIYGKGLNHYHFSASSSDPNDWIVEGIKSAILELNGEGVRFHESPPVAATTVSDDEDFDEDIPF